MTTTSQVPVTVDAGIPKKTPPGRRGGKRHNTDVEGASRAGWSVRIAITVVVILFCIPTLGLLVTSFRTREQATTSSWWSALLSPFSADWTVAGYGEVLSGGMGNAFINTIVVTVPATIIPILIAAMAAYAFTFIEFPGRDVVFMVVVGLLVLPGQVAFIPMLQLFGVFDLVGTFPAVWLMHTGFGMPLAVFLLRSYMSTLPKAVIESAKIDGASHYQTFWKLILPMCVPALASFAIFQFLWVWNDFLIALIFIGGGENETVTLALQTLIGTFGTRWDLLAPGAFITMAMPLIVFFALQRYFVRGMTAGSVKG